MCFWLTTPGRKAFCPIPPGQFCLLLTQDQVIHSSVAVNDGAYPTGGDDVYVGISTVIKTIREAKRPHRRLYSHRTRPATALPLFTETGQGGFRWTGHPRQLAGMI